MTPGVGKTPVLFVHHRPELGGAPGSLAYLIRELDRERFEPHVYCPPGPAAELFRAAGAIVHTGRVAGFTHIWAATYHGRRWLLFARELLLLPAHVRGLRRTLGTRRFALVHLNDSPLVPAAWLARRAGVPVVWHLRSALPEGTAGRRTRLLRRTIRRLAAASIAINEDVAASFDAGSVVIPNAVDLARFHPGDRRAAKVEARLDPDRLAVVFFGFTYPSKGFHTLIEAAGRLRAEGVDADYLIVGGSVRPPEFFRTLGGRALLLLGLTRDYGAEARSLVARLGLEDVVRFVPFAADTSGLYRASDVVAAPSQGPELGRPVLEAAASGVPVVASGSRTGGGVLLPDRTGVLVDDHGAAALSTALGSLLRDAELRERLGAAARRHAEAAFDPARGARAVEAIYTSVAAGSGGASVDGGSPGPDASGIAERREQEGADPERDGGDVAD